MDRTVARLNVDFFRNKLAAETDEAKRQVIRRLLAEEEAKVAALQDKTKQTKGRYGPDRA